MLHSILPNFKMEGVRGKLLLLSRFVLPVLGLALLFDYRSLFFSGNRVIRTTSVMNKAVDIPFETVRPQIFYGLIILMILSILGGFLASYGRHAGKERHAFRNPLTFVLALVVIFANAVLSFYEIELINNYYIARMESQYVWLNIGITCVLYLIFVFVSNSMVIGMCFGNAFFLLWGVVNYFVQSFRGSPLQIVDFFSAQTAANVAGNYVYKPNWEVVACAVVTLAVINLYTHFHLKCNFRSLALKIASRAVAVVLAAAFFLVIFKTDYLADTGIWLRDWQPWYTYRLFGVEAGFFAFANNSFPKQPETYSAKTLSTIIDSSKEENADRSSDTTLVQPDNIICIMNESFSDLTVYPNFEADQDLMPNINALKENTQSGHLMVSVKGGTTSNTEYEFLTGNSCALSPSTVVYTSSILEDQFSMARTLKAQGYTALAMHPYKANGWSRPVVYDRMGFDEFLSIENSFSGADTVRGYVSDEGDYEEIIKQVEAKDEGEKLFIFNVTMQNHSSYNNPDLEDTAHVLNFNGSNQGQADQYATLIKLSDEAVGKLIDYFSKSDEKTLICFFGDHQPEIGDDFWDYCQGKDASALSFDDQETAYLSKFFIWANYDLPEKEDMMLSANYLGPYLMSLTGLETTDYNRYLLGQMETIPAMNAYGYLGTDGHMHEWGTDSVGESEAAAFENYKCLIYNELMGGSSRDETFFGLTE